MQKPSPGRIVLYVMGVTPEKTVLRPAMIVDCEDPKAIDLEVFTNGAIDEPFLLPEERSGHTDILKRTDRIVLRHRVSQDETQAAVGTWHWPARL